MSTNTAELVLLLTPKCSCEYLGAPLKQLFASDTFTVEHRFDTSNQQVIFFNVPYDNPSKMRSKIRKFKDKHKDCTLLEKHIFEEIMKKKAKDRSLSITAGPIPKFFDAIFKAFNIFGSHR